MSSQILEAIDEVKKALDGRKISGDTYAELKNIFNKAIDEIESIELNTGSDYLLLKWGSWKGYDFGNNPKAIELINKFNAEGVSQSAIAQENTDSQKDILCEIIDIMDGTIQNDWDGEYYTKEQAKEYVRSYNEKIINPTSTSFIIEANEVIIKPSKEICNE